MVENVDDFCDRRALGEERYVAGEHMDEGSLRIRRWGLTTDPLFPPTFKRRFLPGDVLFHSRNLNKVAAPDFPGITGEKIFVLRVRRPEVLHPPLLPFLVQTGEFLQYVSSRWAGSTNKFLNKTPLMEYEFALPPMKEQVAVLALLRYAMSASESLLAAEAAGRCAFRSALDSIDAASVPRVRLDECAEISSGGTPDRGDPSLWGGGVPWVKTGEVNYEDITATDETISRQGLAKSSAKLLPPGTILMAMYGQGPTLGRVARLAIAAATNQACAAVQPQECVRSDFVYFWLVREYEAIRRLARGAAQPNLNLGIIKSISIPRISIDAQDSIVEALRACEGGLASLRARRRDLAALQRWALTATIGD